MLVEMTTYKKCGSMKELRPLESHLRLGAQARALDPRGRGGRQYARRSFVRWIFRKAAA
jgi:hypothetical protein